MSIDRIIQQVQRQAQVLASEWQDEQHKIVDRLMHSPSVAHALNCPSADAPTVRWLHCDHLYLESDDAIFLEQLYLQFLGRPIDETGATDYGNQLAQGTPRVLIALNLLRSSERKPNVTLMGTLWLKPFWLLDKILKKLPKTNKVRKFFYKPIYLWERSRKDFWQPIKRVQTQLNVQQQAIATVCQHQQTHHASTLAQLATVVSQIATAQAMTHEAGQNFHLLQHKLNYHQHALERLIDELAQPSHQVASVPTMQAHTQDRLDAYYVAFEDFNRGTREQIRHKLSPYLNIVQQRGQIDSRLSRLPLLDIGCGRGEWLKLLREHHLLATGVDMNPVMVDTCQQTGLDVHHSDALTWLRAQDDNSHAAITGFHIIEHLPFEVLFDLFAEAYRVLAPNGMIIFETPNPENVLVGSHTFYHDFTHRNPITPTAISFLAKYHNFAEIDILRLNPYPSEARVAGHDALTERVNGHLTGPQDFAILAIKPAVDEQRAGA
jgi:O-antigen chain-terminating methyltransferase